MNKIVAGTIAIITVVLLISSVVIPVVEMGQDSIQIHTNTNLNNEGTPLIKGNTASEYKIQWDSALPGMVKVNGNVVTVYFVAGQGATVSPSSKDVTTDLTYGELPTPTRTGYTFDGWYTSTEYTTQVTDTTVVTGTRDINLYAKWTANTYTVTFDPGSGTVSPQTKTVTYGQPYGELPTPEYAGHNFGGWFDSDDNPITSSTVVSIAENHTLDAVYTTEQYLVTFTTDGNGTVSTNSLTVDYGTAYTISDNTVTIGETTITATPNTGYSWGYWTPGTSGTITEATTFTANFYLPPVTITFTAQSPGSVDTAQITDVPRGTQYVVADNVVTITGYSPVTASLPDGYYMTGWNIAQGVGTITDTMTFTAQYEVIEIAQVSCSDDVTWIVTTDGKLFGCGNNTNGQQGDGTTTDVTTFTQRLSTESVAMVSTSGYTTWAVTTDGKLFGCGSNGRGQQGSGSSSPSNVTTFTQRLDNENISMVSCTSNTTWAVTTDGKLFGCGSSDEGKQGISQASDVTTFTQRLSTETVAMVSCSSNTTWAVTTDGKLFGCGDNYYGQQGDGTTTDVTTFTQRLTNETVAMVFCSPNTTWAVTTDGKLFGCGSNNAGLQGDGTTTDVTTFTQRLSTETVAMVFCSSITTWAVTTDGKLFGCGNNGKGQQGNGNSGGSITTFTQRLSTESVAIISGSPQVTWAVTTDGKLFGCGYNDHGQQSKGDKTGYVISFTQRGPAGMVNIPVQVQQLSPQLNPINPGMFNPLPMIQPLNLMSVTPSDIIGTEYTFHAGGEDWMLCTVSTGVEQYALALFYSGASDPIIWDEDVTLTFSNGTMTAENNGSTVTMTYTSIYYKGNGDYLLMSESAYVKADTNIIGYALPSAGNGLMVLGTINDNTAKNIGGEIVVGDSSITSALTDYEDVFQVSQVSAAYDTDSTAVCTSVIVPNKVTITEVVSNDIIGDLLSIIPVLLLLAVIIMAGIVIVVKKAQ